MLMVPSLLMLSTYMASVRPAVFDGDVAGARLAVHRDAFGLGVVVPLVGVTSEFPAPARHIAPAFVHLPGGIVDAFAVFHAPVIVHAILGGVAPRRRHSVAVRGVAGAAQYNVGARNQLGAFAGLLRS